MTDHGYKMDTSPDTQAIPALLSLVYLFFADWSWLSAVAVPVFSIIGSGLIVPFVREWCRFYFDKKRKALGLPIREETD